MPGPGTAVRVSPSRQRADEWAVVLAAAGTPHWLRRRLDGWALIVPPEAAESALASLDAYDRENFREAPSQRDETTSSSPMTIVGALVALLLIGFFAITGPRASRSVWFEHGSADATRMMAGEWWRAITALTLHADAPHLLGNAVATVVLMTAVCWRLGSGVGLWLILAAGAGGNAVTALVHGGDHVSVGTSTATFGAIGILAALRMITGRAGADGKKSWVVIAASLALLALLGTSPHADLLAHLFGLLMGGGLGLIAALALRWAPPAPLQWLLALAAGAAVVGAWRAAL
jgi:membrane associated rhomboid family serine protease